MANQSKISQALDIKLGQLSGLPSTVQYENTTVELPDTGLSLEVYIIPGRTSYPTLGINAPADEYGIYQVNVVAPRNVGRGVAIDFAEDIRSHFARGSKLIRDGVAVRINNVTIGPGITSEDDQKYRIPVSIYYKSFSN